jgi:hypothetical protein
VSEAHTRTIYVIKVQGAQAAGDAIKYRSRVVTVHWVQSVDDENVTASLKTLQKMASTEFLVKTVSVSIALLGAGGIAALSLFDVPELQSQPASRSLPSIRWLFSRGSHIFPQAAVISSAGFAYLAYNALPVGAQSMLKTSGYLAAAGLALSIAPFTAWIMIPTNFTLIKKNEEKGGFRSSKASKQSGSTQKGGRSALDSVRGHDEGHEFTDLSGP